MLADIISPVNSSVAVENAGALPPAYNPAVAVPAPEPLFLPVASDGDVEKTVPSYF
jgi:hypothetical protein